MDKAVDVQSPSWTGPRRLKLVADIQHKLEADEARPMRGWRNE